MKPIVQDKAHVLRDDIVAKLPPPTTQETARSRERLHFESISLEKYWYSLK